MSVSSVIKSVIARQGVTVASVAAKVNMSPQAFANKLARGSFSVDDAIRVASATEQQLAFIDKDGRTTAFVPEDAAPPRKSGMASGKIGEGK